ncbi:lipopolysaccharide heptosyltransferase I [bacterium]|nr:lipopolysaccharide heptosyltransferase I [bacterium]
MSKQPQRILIVKLSSMGDILHALPAVCALRQRFPSARIDWLVDSRFAEILVDHPAIDQLFIAPSPAWIRRIRWGQDAFRGISQFRFACDLRAEKFDTIIDLQGLLRSALLSRTIGASRLVGATSAREGARWFYDDLLPTTPSKHVIEQHLEMVEAIRSNSLGDDGLYDGRIRFDLNVRAVDRDRARQALLDRRWSLSEPYIIIAPQSSQSFKDWEPAKFRQLMEMIQRRYHLPILLIGGRSEMDRCRSLSEGMGPKVRVAVGHSLGMIMALLSMSTLTIGPDTGPVHLASALGIPTISIFGPTDPCRVYPWGSKDLVVQRKMSCLACQQSITGWNANGRRHSCLEAITPRDVMEKIEIAFHKPSRRIA